MSVWLLYVLLDKQGVEKLAVKNDRAYKRSQNNVNTPGIYRASKSEVKFVS